MESLKQDKRIDARAIINALNVESRFSIYLYLLIFNELTMDDLCILMNKSKSTIHHHIQELIRSNFIEEYTKPGSKTRYYKLNVLRLDEVTEAVYNQESFDYMTFEEKIDHLEEYFSLGNLLAKINQNMLNLVYEQHANLLAEAKTEKIDVLDALSESKRIFIANYTCSEKYGEEFQEELTQLIKKYYKKEVENPDQERPRKFFMIGLDIMDILKKKYLKED